MSDYYLDWLDEDTQKIIKDDPKASFGNGACTYHYWIKYTGLREIDYYCQYCNAKKPA